MTLIKRDPRARSITCRGLTVEVFEVGEEVHFLVKKFRYININSIDAG